MKHIINVSAPQIKTPIPKIDPHKGRTPLFCFCNIANDKEARQILRDKQHSKSFVDSILTIAELKDINNIIKSEGLDFEPLEKPEHSVRMSLDYRTIFDFKDMHFILKTIKHKNNYKKKRIW